MIVTRARLGTLMGILFCTFGCKGAGHAFHGVHFASPHISAPHVSVPHVDVAPHVAVAAVRTADAAVRVAGAVANATQPGGDGPNAFLPDAPSAPPGAPPPSYLRPRCEELLPTPSGQRAQRCNGRVIVQDPETGLWRIM